MNRPFSPEVSNFIKRNKEIHNCIVSLNCLFPSFDNEIKKAVFDLLSDSIIEEIRKISVDELNRNKNKFRVNALKDAGYQTIADIQAASIYALSSICGISKSAAINIKNEANDIAEKIRKNINIQINVDNKTYHSTKVVVLISKVRQYRKWIRDVEAITQRFARQLDIALSDIASASNAISWFFASRKTKEKAKYSFDFINQIIELGYDEEQKKLIQQKYSIDIIAAELAWDDFSENSIQFFNILEKLVPNLLCTADANHGLSKKLAKEIQEQCYFPDGLLCELRRYQEFGVKYILHQGNVLLGDEMGLGKTIQAIATMVSLRNTGADHFFVVCPASVLHNWHREIRKKSLLNAIVIHGLSSKLAYQTWLKEGGVAITTFGVVGKIVSDFSNRFSLLVVDEAHSIKNPDADRTKNVKKLCAFADRILFMTGTALENKVEEMVRLIQMLQPHIASSLDGMLSLSKAAAFRTRIAPVYYRRKREEVLKELPDLIESEELCSMNPIEKEAYIQSLVCKKNLMAIRRVSWNVDDLHNSSKANRMKEIIEEAISEERKVIVFSFFLETIEKIKKFLEPNIRCTDILNGYVSPKERQKIIDNFEESSECFVLLAQIQAGGTGLNIQSASVVIICEPQLKPSIENQAISRAYRMGQVRSVLVYRLICENSVDERIFNLLVQKQKIFDEFADKSVAARQSVEIDNQTLNSIIEEEIKRINTVSKN